jgi:hypothetical protein
MPIQTAALGALRGLKVASRCSPDLALAAILAVSEDSTDFHPMDFTLLERHLQHV